MVCTELQHKRWASGGNIAELFRINSGKREESQEQETRYSQHSSPTPASSGTFDEDLLQLNLGRDILQHMPLEMLDNVDNAEVRPQRLPSDCIKLMPLYLMLGLVVHYLPATHSV
jgi:hypothetical protein